MLESNFSPARLLKALFVLLLCVTLTPLLASAQATARSMQRWH